MNENIPTVRSDPDLCDESQVNLNCNGKGTLNRLENKERLFKRKDEGYMSGTRSRQLRRKNHLAENKQTLDKERSSSMSRLLDE